MPPHHANIIYTEVQVPAGAPQRALDARAPPDVASAPARVSADAASASRKRGRSRPARRERDRDRHQDRDRGRDLDKDSISDSESDSERRVRRAVGDERAENDGSVDSDEAYGYARVRQRADATTAQHRVPELWGPRWLHREAVERIRAMHSSTLVFARIVAGLTNLSIDALTEPLESALERYVQTNGDTLESFVLAYTRLADAGDAADAAAEPARAGADPRDAPYAPPDGTTKPSPPRADERRFTVRGMLRSKALYATLALALHHAGVLKRDTIDGFRTLERAQAQRDIAALHWHAMPQHLGYVFFTTTLQAALEAAKADVQLFAERDDLTFHELTTLPELRPRFAQLVAANIMFAKNDLPTAPMRDKARRVCVAERRNLSRYFAHVALAHDAAPKRAYAALYDFE